MMVQPGLAGQSTQEGGGSSNKGKRRQKKLTMIQRLFETCKEVFSGAEAGVVPAPEDVERIRSILDNMTPPDVGLTPKLPSLGNRESGRAPSIEYCPIYEGPKFSIVIFCLPPSGVIPLHNHPGMTVFSKLLVGSMHIKSYDWVNAQQNFAQHPGRHLAKVKKDAVLTAPCETSILYPADGGNIHRFTARTGSAVLDVLGPPYSHPEGRHCQYYNAFPYSSSDEAANIPGEGEYAWLEEKPQSFFLVPRQYKGPKVVER